MEGLGHRVETLLHHLSVNPLSGAHGEVTVGEPWILTNYIFFLLIAFVVTLVFFVVASRKVSLVPSGIANVAEAGIEFVDDMCAEVIGDEVGRKYVPFIGTLFFFILFSNLLGLIPSSLPGTGTMGVTVTWAVMVFLVYNGIGVKKNGLFGYLKSFVPSGVRNAGPGMKWTIGPFLWVLEVISHFVRPVTLSVRLFANMYAGHIILGIFAAFVAMTWTPGIEEGFSHALEGFGIGGAAVGLLSLVMLVLMYAFEVFVAFIQAYVFAILTAVYIGGAEHAGEH